MKQTLTPPDGARDLLPAEYAYRLTSRRSRTSPRRVPVPGDRPRATSYGPASALAAFTRPMRTVTLYTHPAPPLRRRPRRAPARQGAVAFTLHEVNIETDDALHQAYLERIPVICLDGEHLSDFFVDEPALTARLHRDG